MKILLALKLCFEVAAILAPSTMSALGSWENISMVAKANKNNTMMCIATDTEVLLGQKKTNGYIIIMGRKGTGNYKIGVTINRLTDFISNKELSEFRGPDLSKSVMKNNAFELSINKIIKDEKINYNTRMILESSKILPGEFKFNTEEMLVTNCRPGQEEKNKMFKFIKQMGSGFREGTIVVGGAMISESPIIKFNGNNVESEIKKLTEFVGQ